MSDKLPALHFYPGDWKKDLGVQSLCFFDRHVWFECMLLMHESEERGVLVLNNKPIVEESLARMLGLDNQILTKSLAKIIEMGVCSIREDGAIYCRRMVKDQDIRLKRIKAGSMGGNPNLLKQDSTKPQPISKQNPESETEIEYVNEIRSNNKGAHQFKIDDLTKETLTKSLLSAGLTGEDLFERALRIAQTQYPFPTIQQLHKPWIVRELLKMDKDSLDHQNSKKRLQNTTSSISGGFKPHTAATTGEKNLEFLKNMKETQNGQNKIDGMSDSSLIGEKEHNPIKASSRSMVPIPK